MFRVPYVMFLLVPASRLMPTAQVALIANLIKATTGSRHMAFVATAIMNFVVVALALSVPRPLRTRSLAVQADRPAGAE